MSRTKLWMALAMAGFIGLCWSGQAMAQTKAPPADGAGRGGRTRMTAEQMRERMEEWRQRADDQLRERLGATVEEMKVLKPRIEKVQTLQREARGGMRGMMGFGGFGGRTRGTRGTRGTGATATPAATTPRTPTNRDGTPREQTDVEKKTAALTALRAARAKGQQKLTQARKELQEVLTPRQEAMCVLMGMLV